MAIHPLLAVLDYFQTAPLDEARRVLAIAQARVGERGPVRMAPRRELRASMARATPVAPSSAAPPLDPAPVASSGAAPLNPRRRRRRSFAGDDSQPELPAPETYGDPGDVDQE